MSDEGPELEMFAVGELQVAELLSGAVTTEREVTDVVGNAAFLGADYVLLRAEQLAPEFFDLSSRFAGTVMQKFSNYRVRLVIVGGPDAVSGAASESLRALIRESNRGDQTWFVKDRDEAVARIGGA